MHARHLILAALLVAFASGCTPDADPRIQQRLDAEPTAEQGAAEVTASGKPWPQIQFERAVIPGTAAQAKLAGFTECEIRDLGFGHKAVACKRDDTRFLGLKLAWAEVVLDAADNLKEDIWEMQPGESVRDTTGKHLDQLTYPGVIFQVASQRVDAICLGQARAQDPYGAADHCTSKVAIEDVVAALKRDGWQSLPYNTGVQIDVSKPFNGAAYGKRGVPLLVKFDGGLTLERLTKFIVAPANMAWVTSELDRGDAETAAKSSAAAADQALLDQMKETN